MAGSPDGVLRDAANAPGARAGAGPGKAFLGRIVVAHFIAYPIAIVAAIGATPIALWVRQHSIDAAGPTGARWAVVSEALTKYRVSATEAAQVQIVLDSVVLMTVAIFTVVHLAALPWAIGAARGKARLDAPGQKRSVGFRLFAGITAATLILVAVSGTAGWLWLFLQ